MSLITATFALFTTLVLATPLSYNDFWSYDNVFLAPEFIVAKNWSSTTADAQQSIINWANALGAQGPWSVTYKTTLAPSGDPHDYVSYAPYYWPNCTGVGNTTELTPQQIATTCPYVQRDGKFNPDYRSVNDSGSFSALADAVLFNTLAWQIDGSPSYASTAVSFIKTWFLDPDTYMNPNLTYAQVVRGPGKDLGDHEGVLDLHTIVKIISGILIMKKANYAGWTTQIDTAMVAWCTAYLNWLETDPIAKQEAASTNNHGTWAFNQLGAIKLYIGDLAGARTVLGQYFNGIYQNQIDANGEQPLEAIRTRPYHYRAYNLAAMIINAKIGSYVGLKPDPWTTLTKLGGNIQDACNFAMTINPNATNEYTAAPAQELYGHVAEVAAHYGDPDQKYENFLLSVDSNYPASPYFFWEHPLALPSSYVETSTSSRKSSGESSAAVGIRAGSGVSLTVSTTLWALVLFFLTTLFERT